MQTVSLRDAGGDDAPALARLYLASRAAALPGLVEAHGLADVAAWLRGQLIARHQVRVAASAGDPVGYIGFALDPVQGPTVFHVYLDPAWRRQRLGTQLLAEALAARGGRLSRFCIACNHAARGFYERHGFRAAACPDCSINEEGEPDILCVRDAAPQTDNPGASA